MKKLLLVLTVILGSTVAHGQNYPPLNNNSCWYVNVSSFSFSQDFWIIPEKDTIISSFTYKKYIDSASGQQVALVREDVPNKKVYRYVNNADVLMFDFTLQLTNTITLGNGLNYVVDIVDSINVASGKRRTLQLNHYVGSLITTGESWIEGVGNWGYPLKPFFELPSDPAYHINCSYQNGADVFNFGLANGQSPTNCPTPPALGINENFNTQNILMFPNPFSSVTTLQTDKFFKEATLTVYNSFGQIVKQIKNISAQTITLYRDNLPSGFYLMRLTQDNKIIATEKLVITD